MALVLVLIAIAAIVALIMAGAPGDLPWRIQSPLPPRTLQAQRPQPAGPAPRYPQPPQFRRGKFYVRWIDGKIDTIS